MPNRPIYLDNQIILADDRLLEALSPGNLPGCGVFETMRFGQNKIFFFERHLQRMQKGLAGLGLRTVINKAETKRLILQMIKKNRLKNGQVRLSVWEAHGFKRCSVIVREYKQLALSVYQRGYCVGLFPRRVRRFYGPDVKSIEYGFYRKASDWAKSNDFDEAILLNSQNELVEGSRTNMFLVKEGIIISPKLSSGCLNGITRRIVLELAMKNRITVKEVKVTLDDLKSADEVFLTNAILGVMSVRKVGRWMITKGEGRLTKKVRSFYKKYCLS